MLIWHHALKKKKMRGFESVCNKFYYKMNVH